MVFSSVAKIVIFVATLAFLDSSHHGFSPVPYIPQTLDFKNTMIFRHLLDTTPR